MIVERLDRGVRVGRLVVIHGRQAYGAPMVDEAAVTLTRDGVSRSYAGLAFSRGRERGEIPRAVFVATERGMLQRAWSWRCRRRMARRPKLHGGGQQASVTRTT